MTNLDSARVIPMQPQHRMTVARLHGRGLPRGFLSQLGEGFLARLYTAISRAPRSGVWVGVTRDDRCIGYLAGSCDIRKCYRSALLRAGPILLCSALPGLFSRRAFSMSLETVRYPFRKHSNIVGEERAADEQRIHAELLAIAVDAEARGLGLGRQLVLTFEEALRAWGHSGPYRVATAAEDPVSNAFYKGVGFALNHKFSHHGHRMALYIKSIEPSGKAEETGS